MDDVYVVQVKQELYAYKCIHATSLVWYSNLTSGQITKSEKATPPNRRCFPIINNFDDKFIFVGGGQYDQFLKTVDMYTIASNTW